VDRGGVGAFRRGGRALLGLLLGEREWGGAEKGDGCEEDERNAVTRRHRMAR
jgi:hypothetical protein